MAFKLSAEQKQQAAEELLNDLNRAKRLSRRRREVWDLFIKTFGTAEHNELCDCLERDFEDYFDPKWETEFRRIKIVRQWIEAH